MIIKKIASAVMYVLIGYVIDTSLVFLGFIPDNGGNGISLFSILVLSIAIGALSYSLRVIKIKKQNKGMDSAEYAAFNDTVKTKVAFIVKTIDFKIEMIIYCIISILFTGISFAETAIVKGIEAVFANPINILLLFAGIIILPLYMAVIDIFVWYKALNKCFKIKPY